MTLSSFFVMLWASVMLYVVNKRIDTNAEHSRWVSGYIGENRRRLIVLEQKCQCKPLEKK